MWVPQFIYKKMNNTILYLHQVILKVTRSQKCLFVSYLQETVYRQNIFSFRWNCSTLRWARLKVFLLISAATRCHCVDEKRLFFPLFQLFFPFDLIKYDFQKDEPIRNKHGWCEKVKRGKYVLQCITMVMQTLPGSFF